MDTLAAILRSLRETRGLSQERLAELARVSLSTIRDMEAGRRAKGFGETYRRLTHAMRSLAVFTADESHRWSAVTGLARSMISPDVDRALAAPPPLPQSVHREVHALMLVHGEDRVLALLRTIAALNTAIVRPIEPPGSSLPKAPPGAVRYDQPGVTTYVPLDVPPPRKRKNA